MTITLNVQVGRLRTHPDGGWMIVLDAGEIVCGPNDTGLTFAEAEEFLDELELGGWIRWSEGRPGWNPGAE